MTGELIINGISQGLGNCQVLTSHYHASVTSDEVIGVTLRVDGDGNKDTRHVLIRMNMSFSETESLARRLLDRLGKNVVFE